MKGLRRVIDWLWRHAKALAGRASAHRIGLAAAGCAFYGTLALVPAASVVISLFGLLLDPHRIEPHLDLLAPFLPADAFSLIRRLVLGLTEKPRAELGAALIAGAMVALWSSSAGTRAVLAALNLAYDETDRRTLLHSQALALGITAIAVFSALLTLMLLVAMPIIAGFVGLGAEAALLLRAASLAAMMLYVGAMLASLYRFGPHHAAPDRRYIWPGVGAATLLWLAASGVFTIYAERLAHFDATYGPLGAIATVMVWLWVSSFAVLLGAELNAALEQERASG
ncbi:MAG: YihY/virulence factor BrkB family protein [Alphaproteobacteria bacterium]|nr:YihY/virulence factor BrkB family protein [Alphaproteobacteria bacterium]